MPVKEVFAEGFGHNASKMKEGVEEGKKRGGNAKPATANALALTQSWRPCQWKLKRNVFAPYHN